MYLEKLQIGTWSVIFLLEGHLPPLMKLIITCQMYQFQKSTSTTHLQWRFVVDARATFVALTHKKHDIALLDSWTQRLGRSAELLLFFLVSYVNVLDAWQRGNLTLLINPIPRISRGQIQSSVPPSPFFF